MNCPTQSAAAPSKNSSAFAPASSIALLFETQFQRALRNCVRRGFSVEESFAMIWEETQERIELPESEESRVYRQLTEWARELVRR
jgi:hypothetical protein